jgi:general secretion pathway protein L
LSEVDALLLFLNPDGAPGGWALLRAGEVHWGEGEWTLDQPLPVAAVAPADSVSLHWLEVPAGLAPAQAAAAARMMAAEVSAQPLGEMHVAVGAETGEATRPVAIVPALTMAGWLSALQARGVDPDLVLPETLLLPRPEEGFVHYEREGVPLYRGRDDAFSVEPDLAELVVGDAPVRRLDDAAFQAGLVASLAAPAVNLRQGAFAKRRRWKLDRRLVRRLATLGLLILLVTLLIQVAAIMRYTFAADALERDLEQVAARTLRTSGRLTNAPVQLERRLTELRGSGAGYSAIASDLFAAVRATANAELTALIFEPDGTLRATIQGDSPATLDALRQRVEGSGYAVDMGGLRSGGGRPTAELTVRAR